MPKPQGKPFDQTFLRRLLDEKEWSHATLARNAEIGLRTVTDMFSRKRASLETLARVADTLGVPLADLLRPESRVSSVHGLWEGTAEDFVIPDHPYAIPPVHYTLRMTIAQTGPTFTADGQLIGQKGTPQEIMARGWLKEDGNFLMLEWWSAEEGVNDYGTALLEHTADGEALKGWFVGRERMHGPGLVLGRIELYRTPRTARLELSDGPARAALEPGARPDRGRIETP